MILPAQFANTVREGENINFCPYCSRILFYEETDEEEVYDFSFDQAGSLADLADDDPDSEGLDEEEREERLYDDDEIESEEEEGLDEEEEDEEGADDEEESSDDEED